MRSTLLSARVTVVYGYNILVHCLPRHQVGLEPDRLVPVYGELQQSDAKLIALCKLWRFHSNFIILDIIFYLFLNYDATTSSPPSFVTIGPGIHISFAIAVSPQPGNRVARNQRMSVLTDTYCLG